MAQVIASRRAVVARGILEAIGNTPLVEMPRLSPKAGVRLFAKLEGNNPTGSLKDRIAKYMIERAEASGELTRDKVILEATSGNTGISLAMIGMLKGYPVTVVMPENVSQERRQLLRLYGAKIICSKAELGTNGAIELAMKLAQDKRYYPTFQYGNPANVQAHYQTTAQEILEALPEVDIFVAGLGTGGTLMGVGRRLKEHNPRVKIVAAAPHPGDLIFGLRSLEEGFTPPILDLSLLDARILVESKDAFAATRELLKKEGVFAGVSSGAVLHCTLRTVQKLDKGNIVCLLADGGWKYLSTNLWTRELSEEEMTGKIWW